MSRNSSRSRRNGVYYNLALLHDAREVAGLTVHGVAMKLRMNRDTVRKVFQGKASQKQVWRVAKFFKLDWRDLHDLDLLPPDESHRAVLNERTVR